MSATPNDDDPTTTDPQFTRRRAMQIGAATATTIALGGVGTVSGAESLDYSSEFVHDPHVDLDLAVAEVDRSRDMGHVEYIDDNGEVQKLEGGAIAPRPDTDSTTAYNPVSLAAHKIDAKDFRKFPRGATFDSDGDGEDDSDLDVVDAQHWTKDMAGSAGTGTIETLTGANGADVLHVSTSSQTSGDTALFQFNDFSIADGELRKRLQLVVDVNTLESGVSVNVKAVDSTGSAATARIEPGADTSLVDVVTDSTGTGVVYQAEIGELVDSLDTIERLEVTVSDANADLTFTGINVEKEAEWDFGTREFVNADDELETETVREPSGSFSITGLDTMGSDFDNAVLSDVTYTAEIAASRLPSEYVDHEFSAAERYSIEHRHEVVYNFPIPSAYDISPNNIQLRDVVRHPGDRYKVAEHDVGTETLTLDDLDDYDMTDATSQYGGATVDDELSIRSASAGDTMRLALNYLVRDSERDGMTASSGGAAGAAGAGAGDGGIMSSTWAWIGTFLAGVGGYVAWARRAAGR